MELYCVLFGPVSVFSIPWHRTQKEILTFAREFKELALPTLFSFSLLYANNKSDVEHFREWTEGWASSNSWACYINTIIYHGLLYQWPQFALVQYISTRIITANKPLSLPQCCVALSSLPFIHHKFQRRLPRLSWAIICSDTLPALYPNSWPISVAWWWIWAVRCDWYCQSGK